MSVVKGEREETKLSVVEQAEELAGYTLKQGITYLGWRYILKPNGRIICKPRKGRVSKLKRKMLRMKKAGVPLDTISESFRDSVSALEWGDTKKEIRTLNKFFKEEIQNEGCQVSR